MVAVNSVDNNYIRTGLIGFPIDKSMSPSIHGDFFAQTGIGGEYSLWPLPDARQIPAFLDAVIKKKLRGFNVTIPYKRQIIDYLDEVEESAAAIGAVNTVVHNDGVLSGFNTDVYGVRKLFETNNITIAGARILIFGCGGAARAALSVVKETAAGTTCVVRNVNSENCTQMRGICDKINVVGAELAKEQILAADILVNALPAAASAHYFETQPAACCLAAVDLNYQPLSRFLEKYSGSAVVCNGKAMLYYQAAEAFRLWTGRFPIQDA